MHPFLLFPCSFCSAFLFFRYFPLSPVFKLGRFVKAGCVMMLLGIAQNAFGMLTARNKSGM